MPKLQQIIYPEHIQEYSRSIILLREELHERFGLQNYGTGIYVVSFSFVGRH
jgi:hypothetical protein